MHHWETEGRKKMPCIKYDESRDVWYMVGVPFDAIFTWKRTCKTFLCWWTGLSCIAVINVFIVELVRFPSVPLICFSYYHSLLYWLCSVCPQNVHLILSFLCQYSCKINIKEYFTNPIARINVGNVQWIVKRQYYCMPCSILNVSTVCRNVNKKHFILGWITFNRFVLIKSVRCPRRRLAY